MVGTLEEETEEETVQVEDEEMVEEMARPSKQKGEKYQEQPPTRALLIMNGPLNGHLLL